MIEFLTRPIFPEWIKSFPGGYNDWPPVWLVLFFGLAMLIVFKLSGWDDVDD